VAFTLATFPAAVVVQWFVPPELSVSGVQGTLWSGSTTSIAADGLAVRDVRWSVRPWQLLLGRVDAAVEARLPDGFVATDVVASPSSIRFANLRGGTSLPSLTNLLPVRGMRGQASFALESLELENNWPTRVVGELRVSGLEVAPFASNGRQQLLALGDYTVTFTAAPPRELAARFVDNGGPLEVGGTVTVDATRSYTLDALIEPRPGADEQLVQGLTIMTAEPDAEGRRRLTLTGSL
jgi:general secretion pathway protein N